jgi:4-amino-4-deoxy-L-arabinose transferase-like glycosyltransferase
MEFMGIAVGILALLCALVLLFGRQGARKVLGWSFGLLILGWVTIAVWAWANAPKPITDADIARWRNATAGTVGPAPQHWQDAPIIAPAPSPQPGPTLNIGGHKVQVDSSFLQLSPDQQKATIDEISRSLPSAQPAPNNAATAQRYPGSWELAPKPLSDAEVGLAPVQRYPGGWEFDPVTKQWHHNQ